MSDNSELRRKLEALTLDEKVKVVSLFETAIQTMNSLEIERMETALTLLSMMSAEKEEKEDVCYNCDEDAEHWTDDFGTVIHNVHKKGTCRNTYCTIHNPSDHPLRKFKQLWRVDRGMMERVCAHRVGHPDPDEFLYGTNLVHGCDGCCEGGRE